MPSSAAQTNGDLGSFNTQTNAITTPTASYASSNPISATPITTTNSSSATVYTGSNQHNQKSGGVSSNVLAGVAVGAAVGAAIIAAVVTWMLLRSKSRFKGQLRSQSYPLMRSNDRKEFTEISVIETPDHATGQIQKWEQHLPQPADDNSIRFSAKTLFHQIELHVENFYSDTKRASKPISQDTQVRLRQFDYDHLPATVTILLQQGKSTAAVIKHCLAKEIVSSIDIPDANHSSFLSTEYATLAAATRERKFAKQPGAREAFSQWRILTAYLRSETDAATAERDAVIEECARKFSTAFAPWAAPTLSDTDRVQNLIEIMRNAARFGDLIFSQGSEFQYVWDSTIKAGTHHRSQSRNHGTIAVSPGLVKLTDEKARSLKPVQVILPPVTAEN